ncbi:MAG: urease accessory protein UreD [Polaromonas sp.]|uniref:urease accessory protein UreD n=1 Tax=Polaromonas sp. TaxID=1869339 RepID=UPI0025EFBCCD|nr:urease accessory protein UreD [Polaromonas sp.]MBI2726431.1 urease accessory protein UreD [Polaromonas sp.]
MPWHAQLDLDYSLEDGRCVARHTHTGPLRILQSLYPEGDGICHNVLVHPPGGLVGGDTLDIAIRAGEGSHGLITTPGATRFYRSEGEPALQRTSITVNAGARLEWLPLEALCYSGCLAENQLRMNLAPGAELLGWDVTALGLPAAGKPFQGGSFCQHIEVPGLWLERATIKAADGLLMNGPLGLAGHRCIATLFFIAGTKLDKQRRQSALDIARGVIEAHSLCATAGATSPDGQVVLVRVLAPVVEPAMALLRQVWLAWRSHLWGLPSSSPRIWST